MSLAGAGTVFNSNGFSRTDVRPAQGFFARMKGAMAGLW